MSDLRTLDALAAANITGTDATTSLDTFITRASAYFAAMTEGMSTADRHAHLQNVFGSDAVRVASVLIGGAR